MNKKLSNLDAGPRSAARYSVVDTQEVPSVETVLRKGKKFDKKKGGHHHVEARPGEYVYDRAMSRDSSIINVLCCMNANAVQTDTSLKEAPPDIDFHANSYVKLSHGVTAYKLLEPSEVGDDELADNTPVIICLHGISDSSYIWSDLADLLCDYELGPSSRVLVYDMYGRGRSPWTSVPMTMNVLVTQLKDLLEYLDLFDEHPVHLIGYDLGGAVALGFSAKFGNHVASMTLLAPFGMHHVWLNKEKLLKQKYIGEFLMLRRKGKMADEVDKEYLETGIDVPHANLIKKQKAMVEWQIKNTPGYLGAILSTYRLFPIRGMQELFLAVGRHTRPTCVLWGDHDNICPYKACIVGIEEAFPNCSIVDVIDCGHNCLFEKFEDVAKEILSFYKIVFDKLYAHNEEEEH